MSERKVCLGFADPWSLCTTAPYSYSDLQVRRTYEALTLESLRDLTIRRAQGCQKQAQSFKEQLEWLQKYLSFLTDFASKAEVALVEYSFKRLNFFWTSPLAGAPHSQFHLPGADYEQCMAMMLYAAGLREAGHVAASSSPSSSGSRDAKEPDYTEAASLLRKAAGAYQHTQEALLGPLQSSLPAQRPAELVPAMAETMGLICMAEAQAMIGFRAELKGSLPGTVASLMVGASDLCEQAASLLKSRATDFSGVSPELRKFIALSSSLYEARAKASLARQEQQAENMGLALSNLKAAAQCIQDCKAVAGNMGQWQTVLDCELEVINKRLAVYHNENNSVYFQPIAKTTSSLPPGKVIATPAPFELPELRVSVL